MFNSGKNVLESQRAHKMIPLFSFHKEFEYLEPSPNCSHLIDTMEMNSFSFKNQWKIQNLYFGMGLIDISSWVSGVDRVVGRDISERAMQRRRLDNDILYMNAVKGMVDWLVNKMNHPVDTFAQLGDFVQWIYWTSLVMGKAFLQLSGGDCEDWIAYMVLWSQNSKEKYQSFLMRLHIDKAEEYSTLLNSCEGYLHYVQARKCTQRRLFSEALHFSNKSADLFPTYPSNRLLQSELYMKLEKYEEAIKMLEELQFDDPLETIRKFYLFSLCYDHLGMYCLSQGFIFRGIKLTKEMLSKGRPDESFEVIYFCLLHNLIVQYCRVQQWKDACNYTTILYRLCLGKKPLTIHDITCEKIKFPSPFQLLTMIGKYSYQASWFKLSVDIHRTLLQEKQNGENACWGKESMEIDEIIRRYFIVLLGVKEYHTIVATEAPNPSDEILILKAFAMYKTKDIPTCKKFLSNVQNLHNSYLSRAIYHYLKGELWGGEKEKSYSFQLAIENLTAQKNTNEYFSIPILESDIQTKASNLGILDENPKYNLGWYFSMGMSQ